MKMQKGVEGFGGARRHYHYVVDARCAMRHRVQRRHIRCNEDVLEYSFSPTERRYAFSASA
jgi:hypothetical protein